MYSTFMPQQSQLCEACTAPYCSRFELAIKSHVGGRAPSALGGAAIAELGAKLVKKLRNASRLIEHMRNTRVQDHCRIVWIGYDFARDLQICVACADGIVAKAIASVKGAGFRCVPFLVS